MKHDQDPFAEFRDVIGNLEELREYAGDPVPPVVAKVMDHVDHVSRAIIEKSPFIVIASATSDGYPDISPKGDPVGFVRVLSDKYLAIPDRPGNKRMDTFTNLLQNPYLAIILFIPGKGRHCASQENAESSATSHCEKAWWWPVASQTLRS